ncbi:MAG TPA: PD-(D/E)XK nuclease family protein, partial [Chroococcales cyanobacterium]
MSKEILRLSAHNLREFDRCPRAFALRYKVNRFWPAPDPVPSKRMELGQAFHQVVHQKFLGLDPMIENYPDLEALWQKYNFSSYSRSVDNQRVWSEQNLHVTLDGVGFLARFDRLVRDKEDWTILDWKTGKLDPIKLAGDWQTKLYPFVLAEAGSVLNEGKRVDPSRIKMIYWEGLTGTSF